MNSNQVYLQSAQVLHVIKNLLSTEQGPFLEIGPGRGSITRVIPDPKTLVEPDRRFEKNLRSYEVMWSKIQDVKTTDAKVVVSNLPFDQSIQILIHCVKHFKHVKTYYVILQKDVYMKMMYTRALLYHKMNHAFTIRQILQVRRQCFEPVPGVDAVLIKLSTKTVDWRYMDFLKKLTQPRKKIKNNVTGWSNDARINDYESGQMYREWLELNSSIINTTGEREYKLNSGLCTELGVLDER